VQTNTFHDMNLSTLQTERAMHAKYMPSKTKVATDLAAGMRMPPFPPGTTVKVGVPARLGGDIPAQYPALHSSKAYVHVHAYGWTVVDRADLVPA